MEQVKIGYQRVGHLIAVGIIPEQDIETLSVIPNKNTEYVLTFSDYIKSQIHLNLIPLIKVSGLKPSFGNRDILDYQKSLEYYKHGIVDKKALSTVLSYFYEDVFYFLVRNCEDITLRLVIDCNPSLFPLDSVIEGVTESIDSFANFVDKDVDFDTILEVVRNNRFSYILDHIVNTDDLHNKKQSLATAILCRENLQDLEKEIRV